LKTKAIRMTRKSWDAFKNLFVQNYEFRSRMMESITPVDLNVLSWTFGVELSSQEKKTYLTPIRMMPGIQHWLTNRINSGHNVMLVGDDVNQLVSTILSRKKSVILRTMREPFSFLLVVASVTTTSETHNSRNTYSISYMATIPRSMMMNAVKDHSVGYMSLEDPTVMGPVMKSISCGKRPDMVITGTEWVDSADWNWSVDLEQCVGGDVLLQLSVNPYPIMSTETYRSILRGETENPCILRLFKKDRHVLQKGYVTTDRDEMEEADYNSDVLMMRLPTLVTRKMWHQYVMLLDCTIVEED
jgi:hypothetical protein